MIGVSLFFSKDRPMQLDLALRSYFLNRLDNTSNDTFVLYLASNADYECGYKILSEKYSFINFIRQTNNFKQDMLNIIGKHPVCGFFVDDCIFTSPFNIGYIEWAILNNPFAIGYSLRLGENIEWCYPANAKQEYPSRIFSCHGDVMYLWPEGSLDFGYPLELSSSIYPTEVIIEIMNAFDFTTPNALEDRMSNCASMMARRRPFLLIPRGHSKCFCAPMNKVQSSHKNRSSDNPEYSPEKLLELFLKGKRIKLKNWKNNSPHQEVEYEYYDEQ